MASGRRSRFCQRLQQLFDGRILCKIDRQFSLGRPDVGIGSVFNHEPDGIDVAPFHYGVQRSCVDGGTRVDIRSCIEKNLYSLLEGFKGSK